MPQKLGELWNEGSLAADRQRVSFSRRLSSRRSVNGQVLIAWIYDASWFKAGYGNGWALGRE